MAGPDPSSIEAAPAEHDCATLCRDGCVLGEACPHREAARQAVAFVMSTDWDTLMNIAEAKNLPPEESDPLKVLDNYFPGS
ncbi:hypothetical protein L1047_12060 [Synechococcus sp. Nb3U1]|uniref:hypothetical protein n=1 Tax=Synechococcus sp. Nb3U1 TaxID=1914529 RepID=UPI001F2398CE|nr:hypothetical protein [Synechococcus sp. Nb3U1]MCF2971929.1 hypothetical protein [Synechococcus sp. Nb3U1]